MFAPRAMQIFACGAVAIPEAAMNNAETLAGGDVAWPVYNHPACSKAIGGCSECRGVVGVVAIELLPLRGLTAGDV